MAKSTSRKVIPGPHGSQPTTPKTPSGKSSSSQEAAVVHARINALKKQIEAKVALSPEKAAKILSDWLNQTKTKK